MRWSGGRLRRDVLRHCWDDFLPACCLFIDSTTLQLQTFLADRARYRDDPAATKDLFLGGRATHANGAVDWLAANVMADLTAAKLGASGGKFDAILEDAAEFGCKRLVPRFLRQAWGLLASPLPPPMPAAATQLLLWAVEALARTLAFSPVDGAYARRADVKGAVPLALSSMVALQLAMEALMSECRLNRLHGYRGHQLMPAEFESTSIVLDSSITLLMRAVGEDLSDFAFPPTCARRLQRYAARL